jgi:hypothetical protein
MRRPIYLLLIALLFAVLYLSGTSPADAAGCAPFYAQGSNLCRLILAAEPETFVTPERPANSLYGQRTYAWLEDNANVYPAPDRSVAPKRNVGVGYLYVTVNRSLVNEAGETWYEINSGEYVFEDDVHVVKASSFQGVATQRQPERPFGWVVQNVVPSREPDGAPDSAFGELARYTFVEIYRAVRGAEGWIWYEIGDGRWVKQTYFSIVDVDARPAGVGPTDFWTEVDLYEQTFTAYQGDRLVYATLISSGLNRWPTREGLFQVWSRLRQYKMSGAEGKVDYYYLEDVPYIMYFDRTKGIGLHGTYWHNRFGYKHSHGCVNMSILDAEWTFNWSAGAPDDLWVWVHTSNPQGHLDLGGGS